MGCLFFTEMLGPATLQQNPRYCCGGVVAAHFSLIALVAWKYWFDSTLRRQSWQSAAEIVWFQGRLPLIALVAFSHSTLERKNVGWFCNFGWVLANVPSLLFFCTVVPFFVPSFHISKPKGPEEKGAPRNHPEILSQKLAHFECRFPYDSYGRNGAPLWPFLGEGFWGNIRRPLVLLAPLVYC